MNRPLHVCTHGCVISVRWKMVLQSLMFRNVLVLWSKEENSAIASQVEC
jgi:hypothetical protein